MTVTEALRQAAAQSDAAFGLYVSGLWFPDHLRAASRFAQRTDRGLVLMPRGHAKTTLFIHRAARRIGETRGRRRLGILTAVDDDARARSRAIRALVMHPRFAEVFPWVVQGPLVSRHWSDDHWTISGAEEALGKDYTVQAMGLRSVRAGPRLDDLLADDMVGMQENTTAGQRAWVSETYWSVVDPMVVPGGTRWFLGTRWHDDDIYAELIGKGWPALVRRALQEDGTALWPDYWPLERLEAKRLEMGSAIFDLQFQNDPSGMGGNIFKRAWFKPVDRLPERYVRRAGMDLAASKSERSDYTAVVEWAEDGDHNLYLVGAWRARLDEGHRAWLVGRTDSMETGVQPAYGHPDGPRLLWPLGILPEGFAGARGEPSVPRPISAVNIEATMLQSTFVREVLARTRLPATAVYPDRDKVTRARALAARAEAGKVFYLRGAPGIEDFLHEAVAFPNGEHDDLVDAAVYGADLGGSEFYFTSARR